MPTQSAIKDIRLGDVQAKAAYAAGVQVWPSQSQWSPAAVPGCVLAFEASDVPPGPVTRWPDRSPAGNDLVPQFGSAIASGDFVTCSTANVLTTARPTGVAGNRTRHVFAIFRPRPEAAFAGYGDLAGGALFDLWHYGNTLIWHGHGGGFDTVAGAPTYASDEWHLVEVTWDGTTLSVYVDDQSPGQARLGGLSTADTTWWFGQGRYSGGGDFDMRSFHFYDRLLTGPERTQVRDYLAGLIAPPLFDPASIPGLFAWLDAAALTGYADGGEVYSWPDSSGRGWHAVREGTPPVIYQQSGIGGLPALRFGQQGVTQMVVGQGYGLADRTIFQVVQVINPPRGGYHTTEVQGDPPHLQVYGPAGGTVQVYAFPGVDSGVPWKPGQGQLIAVWCSTAEAAEGISVDGQQVTSGWSVGSGSSPVTVGGWQLGSYGLNGLIGETLIYNRCLTISERDDVLAYLRTKWSLT
jgi:hypothetical protein